MSPVSTCRRLALLAALGLVSACAAPPPPLLDISSHVCAPQPDLISALPVKVSDPLRPDMVDLRIDDTARCLQTTQGPSLYGAFALPGDAVPMMLAVRSIPVGEGLFVPHLLLLDGTGAVQREVEQSALQFRGETLTAFIRLHPGERYLVVASTPQSVGQANSHIIETTSQVQSTSQLGTFTVHTGTDVLRNYVYAHGGKIYVWVSPVPTN